MLLLLFTCGIQDRPLPAHGPRVLKSQLIKSLPHLHLFCSSWHVPFVYSWIYKAYLAGVVLMEIIKSRPSTNSGSCLYYQIVQGHQPPHSIALLDSSSCFWICSFGMCCSLFLECFPPLAPTPCASVHISKHKLLRPECLAVFFS